jgi:hypothetical protein
MNSTTTTTTVPLISSGSAGPLGVLHLPRLWTKLTLGTAGKLADGYDFCGAGFDQMTLNALNLDREKTIAYVEENRPTYLQFEAWIVEQNGGKIPQAAVDEHNKAVKGYNHGDELATSMRASSGCRDSTISDAVTLNMIEDLDELHARNGGPGLT